MANPAKLDLLYMDIAERCSEESHGIRSKVGCIIVQGDNIVSHGWNGTPSGMDNGCEIIHEDGSMTTKPEVLHAESNALMKLAANSQASTAGATLYVTLSPCPECAKLIKQAKINRVVYRYPYRIPSGIDLLRQLGVTVDHLPHPEFTSTNITK
jgi:dCMP deaminase